MSQQLDDAVGTLISTYQSLNLVAQGLVVDAKEVADALAAATPDTAEFIALTVLSVYNPYTAPAKTTKVEKTE
jgi:hypothetical protein